MAHRSSLIEIAGLLYTHLDRRPKPDIAGLDHLPVIKRTRTLLSACGTRLVTGGKQPFFDPVNDVIVMPSPAFYCFARLYTPQTTYALIILHEIVHWSGHRTRLARPWPQQPFDPIYRREECVAELGSALLCHDLGITSRPTLPHARYLNSYLATLPNPIVELQVALARANQAAGFILALARRRLANPLPHYA